VTPCGLVVHRRFGVWCCLLFSVQSKASIRGLRVIRSSITRTLGPRVRIRFRAWTCFSYVVDGGSRILWNVSTFTNFTALHAITCAWHPHQTSNLAWFVYNGLCERKQHIDKCLGLRKFLANDFDLDRGQWYRVREFRRFYIYDE
jgi:hypothetical protein